MNLVDVIAAESVEGFKVCLTFSDGEVIERDLSPWLTGPLFEPLRDPGRFRQLYVDDSIGTIAWPNGADMDAQVLRYALDPVK